MKALSIRQPWVWAILHAGKRVENRDWKPWNPGLSFRGEFLIHASAGMTNREFDEAVEAIAEMVPEAVPLPLIRERLDRGGLVARAEIIGVVTKDGPPSVASDTAMQDAYNSPWFVGHYGLVLANIQPIPFTPLKGVLGFFDVPNDISFGSSIAKQAEMFA